MEKKEKEVVLLEEFNTDTHPCSVQLLALPFDSQWECRYYSVGTYELDEGSSTRRGEILTYSLSITSGHTMLIDSIQSDSGGVLDMKSSTTKDYILATATAEGSLDVYKYYHGPKVR